MASAEPPSSPESPDNELISRLDTLGLHLRQIAEEYALLRIDLAQRLGGAAFKAENGRITAEGRKRIEQLRTLGFPNIEIAAELGVSPPAITNQVRRSTEVKSRDEKLPRGFS